MPANFSWLPVRAWLSNPEHLAWQGVSALVDALRVNFLSWFGVLSALVLLPRRGAWRSDHHRKLTLFLIGSYLAMLVIHFWAALGGKSCQFVCLPGYFLFFNWLGLIGILAAMTEWRKNLGKWRYLLLILVAFASLVGFEYRYQDNFRDLRSGLVFNVFGFERQMLEDRQNLSAGEVGPIWEWLEASLGFDYFRWLRFVWLSEFISRILWWLLPAVFVIGIPWIAYQALERFGGPRPGFTEFGLAVVLAFGAAYASAPLFAQPLRVETCGVDVIEQVEQIGADLNAEIPAGAAVFWDVKSNLPLAYLEDVDLFLPQLNHGFTLVNDPDADPAELDRFGWWNHQIGMEWIDQADYMVVESRFYTGLWEWDERVSSGELSLGLQTAPIDPCNGKQTQLLVIEPNP